MDDRSEEPGALWYDDDAGPVVRPYTVTRGRTCPKSSGVEVDPITLVAVDGVEPAAPAAAPEDEAGPEPAGGTLDEEHAGLLQLCQEGPLSVAELASDADLPLGVVRVLIGDLLQWGRVRIIPPIMPAELPDAGLLRHVISGLRAL